VGGERGLAELEAAFVALLGGGPRLRRTTVDRWGWLVAGWSTALTGAWPVTL